MKKWPVHIYLLSLLMMFLLAGCNRSDDAVVNNTTAPPAQVGLLTVTPADAQLTVAWAAVTGATSYKLYYNTANDSSTATEFTGDGDAADTSRIITGLTNGTPYYVWVKAVNSAGTSDFNTASAPASPIAAVAVPSVVGLLTVTPADAQLTVTWAPVTGATSYEVYYNTANDSSTATKFTGDGNAADTACIITGLTNGTPYYVWAKAVNSAGSSDFSSASSVTVGSSPTITGISPGTANADDTVTITGTGFSTTPGDNAVAFNGTAATITSSTSTQIVVTVPAGATSGTITVTVGGVTATSTSSFTVGSGVAGALDAAFGTSGIVTTAVRGQNQPRGIAIQSDGKILAAGSSHDGVNNYNFAVVRYNTDGSLDTSFDTDGIVTTVVGTYSYARNVAVQADGKILASGDSCLETPGTYCSFAIVRYNADGSVDTGFGTGGIAKAKVAVNVTDWAFAMALQPDGKIVLAGTTRDANYTSFNIVRFNTDGSLDTSFGVNGTATTVVFPGYDSAAYGVAIQSDGKIVAAGKAAKNGPDDYDSDFAVIRYNANGTLDTTFDTDGIVLTDMSGAARNDEAYAVRVQANGKIIVGGFANNGSNNDIAIARYNADGSLDAGFDTDGKVITTIGTGSEVIRGLAIQPDGKIIGVGASYNGSNMDYAVLRYNTNGSLDTSFNGSGIATQAIGTNTPDVAFGVALQSNGKIVVSGYTGDLNYFGIVRYNP